MIDRTHPTLPVTRQCRILNVSRATVYRHPAAVSDADLELMALIDRQYLIRPFYGSRRMAAWLNTEHTRTRGEPQAGAAADAPDGVGGDLPASQHQQGRGGAHQVSLPARRPDDRPRQPGVVLGHHLYSDAPGLSVLGGDHGLAQPCGFVLD